MSTHGREWLLEFGWFVSGLRITITLLFGFRRSIFLNFEELIKNLNSLFPVWGIVDMRPFVRINLFGHRLNNITSASSLCLDHWPSAISMEFYVIHVSWSWSWFRYAISPFHLNGMDGHAVTNDDHWSIFFVTFWGLNWLSICNHCPPDWPRVGQSIRIIFYKTLVSIILFVVYPVSDMYYLISTWCIIYLNFSVRYLSVFDSLQYTLLFWEIY